MAKAPPTRVIGSTKDYKFEEHYPQKHKSSATSLIAFFFSILIYTSIFYIFNLSPSTDLLCNNKFWFAISNTLILIIAADYSSSKDKQHGQLSYQDEYMMHRHAQTTTSSFVSEYPREIETISDHQVAPQKIENPETRPTTVLKVEHDEKPSVDESHETDVRDMRVIQVHSKARKKNNIEAKTYKRSKSEEVRRVAIDDCKSSSTMRRSETMEKHQKKDQVSTSEEDNELSNMSNEELNRRFEEFIQRFNEQIRHQAVADRRPRLTYHHV